jgi:hypothetical protein
MHTVHLEIISDLEVKASNSVGRGVAAYLQV